MNTKQDEKTLVDSITSFIGGDNALRLEVGISAESVVKLGIVAVVTTLLCVLIIRRIK